MLSIYLGADAFDGLPRRYREAVTAAAAEANVRMIAHYDHLNAQALVRLRERGVTLRRFSDGIMRAAGREAFEIYEALAEEDPQWRRVYREWQAFRDRQYRWFNVAEQGFAAFAIGEGEG